MDKIISTLGNSRRRGVSSNGSIDFTVPPNEQLSTSKITSTSGSLDDIWGHLYFDDILKSAKFPVAFKADETIVASKKMSGSIEIRGEYEGKKHILNGQFVTGEDISFETYLKDTSEVTLENKAQSISFVDNVNRTNLFFSEVEDETIVISNGNYRVYLETNDISWNSNIDVDGDQTITIPTKPYEISLNHADYFLNPKTNEHYFYYNIAITSGPFSLLFPKNTAVHYRLLSNSNEISKWEDTELKGTKILT